MESADIKAAGCKQCRSHLVIDYTFKWGDGKIKSAGKYRCLVARTAIFKLKACPLGKGAEPQETQATERQMT